MPGLSQMPQWPTALGTATASGVIRSTAEDFVVEEIPRISPEGQGSHRWFWIEKRHANTDWVARELAKLAHCPLRDVGFAGMKDRYAVTRQWFSVPDTQTLAQNIESADIEGVRLLKSQLHSKKLKRGTLNGNRFELLIRDFQGDIADTQYRLETIRKQGVPNYFGPQRFGHRGQNVQKALSLLGSGARLQRHKRSIYLSALRSFLFNHVLAQRVRLNNWNTLLNGELVMLDGSHSIFPCVLPDKDIEDRCERLDIHPTGPLPGEGGSQVEAEARQLEQAVLDQWPQLTALLIAQRVKAMRRALRLYPAELEWQFDDGNLALKFVLPAGAYATTVLQEILVATEADHHSVTGKTESS